VKPDEWNRAHHRENEVLFPVVSRRAQTGVFFPCDGTAGRGELAGLRVGPGMLRGTPCHPALAQGLGSEAEVSLGLLTLPVR